MRRIPSKALRLLMYFSVGQRHYQTVYGVKAKGGGPVRPVMTEATSVSVLTFLVCAYDDLSTRVHTHGYTHTHTHTPVHTQLNVKHIWLQA